MSDERDDVLAKADALLNKYVAPEPDIPVLTDLVEAPRVDLDAIPVLTEEVAAEPAPSIELDLVPEPLPVDSLIAERQRDSVLAKLEAVEAEIKAEVDARIAQLQQPAAATVESPPAAPSFDLPPGVLYVPLGAPTAAAPAAEAAAPPAGNVALADDEFARIAELVREQVEQALAHRFEQAIAEQLPQALHATLDRALASMLDQFLVTLDEVVRSSIADELKKQLAPFRRPVSTKPSSDAT